MLRMFAFASANAVVPDSAFANFSSVQFAGNDDGSWPCGPDGVSGPVPCTGSDTGPQAFPFGFNVDFYGTQYGGAYVNNNGNVTFGAYLSAYTPFGLPETGTVIVAPFFADVDTRIGNPVEIGTGTLDGHKAFVVDWPGVGCYDENDTVTDNFQMILIDRPDLGTGPQGDDFQIEFNYDSIQWDAGQASGGDSNCTNAPNSESAVAGFSNGTTTTGDSYQLPGSQVSGAFLDSNATTGLIYNSMNSNSSTAVPASSVAVPGRYIFNVENGTPIVSGTPCVNKGATAPPAPAFSVTRGSGNTPDVAAGTGWAPNNEVDIYLDTAAGAHLIGQASTDSGGDFTGADLAPINDFLPTGPVAAADPGEQFPIVAMDNSCDAATVYLTASTPTGTPQPSGNNYTTDGGCSPTGVPIQPAGNTASTPTPPLTTNGASIIDSTGEKVKLASVNWYGAEQADFVPGGLQCQSIDSIAENIAALGFNSVRLSWSNAMYESDPSTCTSADLAQAMAGNPDDTCIPPQVLAANPELLGQHALDILTEVVDALARANVMVILDDHGTDADWTAEPFAGLWWAGQYWDQEYGFEKQLAARTENWIDDWTGMANIFRAQPDVVGMDLRNEPGAGTDYPPCPNTKVDSNCLYARWGTQRLSSPPLNSCLTTQKPTDCTDWRAAAAQAGDAILGVNPNLLVVVEGASTGSLSYSGDLTGVKNFPVLLSGVPDAQSQLVYSSHSYQNYVQNQGETNVSYSTLTKRLDRNWGYIVERGIAPVWVGEFGTASSDVRSTVGERAGGNCVAPFNGDGGADAWFSCFTQYLANNGVSWSYWALNGTMSDGGPLTSPKEFYGKEPFGILDPSWGNEQDATLVQDLQYLQRP